MPKSTRSGAAGPSKRKVSTPRVKKDKPNASPEYLDYMQRHEEVGDDRPILSPEEFDKLDDEYLELFELAAEGKELSDEQNIRLQELMFLLIDPE